MTYGLIVKTKDLDKLENVDYSIWNYEVLLDGNPPETIELDFMYKEDFEEAKRILGV